MSSARETGDAVGKARELIAWTKAWPCHYPANALADLLAKALDLLDLARKLNDAAYDMSRKPRDADDEMDQHGRLNDACGWFSEALEAFDGQGESR